MKQCSCQDPESAASFVNVTVESDGVPILENINCEIPRGGCTAIVGPNGAGKTTLVLVLLDEIPYTGTVCHHGGRSPKIGYVPQTLVFDRGMPLTVIEFMAAFHQKRPLCFGIRKSLREELRALLKETGCLHLEHRALGALSGGELQRVMLSAALSRNPDLLILDEPASGIDFKGGEVCCELLERFRRERGFTQLMVTHDISTVLAHATHVVCLNRMVVAEGEPKKILTDEVLAKTFGLHHGVPEAGSIPGNECHESCCEGKHHHAD